MDELNNTVKIPIATSSFERAVSRVPLVPLHNRFLEASPVLSDNPVALLARPAMRKFAQVGLGPIRSHHSSPGLFDGALFIVSGTFLYKMTVSGVVSLIGELSTIPLGSISWAAVAPIGDVPGRLFIAEGGVLWVYTDQGEALGQLQASGAIANGDQVRIGTVYYQFTNASVDAGAPAGTSGNPWLVSLGISNTEALTNLYNAINAEGVPGTAYSTATEAHPDVRATGADDADLFVAAKEAGIAGNAIVTTETGANIAWNAGTLQGGGDEQLRQAQMPDDAGAISIASINSFVIVVPVQSADLVTIGRFYWIIPGETYVDPIDFATAERSPDGIYQVGVFGNMFWLLGSETTEPWQTTPDPEAPMQRFQSITYDRGAWPGTMVKVKDSLIVVDEQGGVFEVSGGQKRISRPDIEERIRRAMQTQAAAV